MTDARDVFITGGRGYVGGRLISSLLARGHRVRALARPQSADRVPAGAVPVVGNALDAGSFVSAVRPGDTFVHLVGTPHPSPSKAQEFLRVDPPSVRAAVAAARRAGVGHFVYVSVAQPAPVMKTYIAVRAAGEKAIREAGLTATVLRPLVRARARTPLADVAHARLRVGGIGAIVARGHRPSWSGDAAADGARAGPRRRRPTSNGHHARRRGSPDSCVLIGGVHRCYGLALRLMNAPAPARPTKRPFSTITAPRESTVSETPVTSRPS